MKDGPRKETVKTFTTHIDLLKKCTIELGVIQHVLRENRQDMPKTVADAFGVISGALHERMSHHYESLFAWAITQPEEIQDLVRPEVERRWGREFEKLKRLYGWEEVE